MLDLENLEQYRENNRLEAKKAQGGLPESIWESYAAFANTHGGIILLGVIERKEDKRFESVPLPSPEALVAQLWAGLNDTRVVNINILAPGDVEIEESDGNRIVLIHVPAATVEQRPVYIGTDPFRGTYCRNGEGDYRCSRAEVLAMLGDRPLCPVSRPDPLVSEE